MIKDTLERNATLDRSGRLKVDEIGGGEYSLGPKMRWKRSGDHQRTSRLKKVVMLALNHAILSMSTRTRELRKSAMLSKNTTQHLGNILASGVSTEHTNRRRELSVNHGSKMLIDGKNLTTRSHKIKPSVTREIIYENNLVSMAPFRSEGSRTPYIRMD